MASGLADRRIALYCGEGSEGINAVQRALEAAGARVHRLNREDPDEAWHGAIYAGLVIVGGVKESAGAIPRLVQLVREFMVSDKPVAAMAVSLDAIQADETLLAVLGNDDPDAFAKKVVKEFSERLEQRAVDEMSDLSFPASDPPATTPLSAGHLTAEREARG